jgi:hypothetical protein
MLNSFIIARWWVIVNVALALIVNWRLDILRQSSPPGLCDFGCILQLNFIIVPLLISALCINATWILYYLRRKKVLSRRRFIYTYSLVLGTWAVVLLFDYASFNNYL